MHHILKWITYAWLIILGDANDLNDKAGTHLYSKDGVRLRDNGFFLKKPWYDKEIKKDE